MLPRSAAKAGAETRAKASAVADDETFNFILLTPLKATGRNYLERINMWGSSRSTQASRRSRS